MLTALQRRGWVLLVAVVVAATCAYLVASRQSETYTAESTAVVAAARHSLLTSDQADTLAGTYAVLIPKDTAILGAVATALGTSESDVQEQALGVRHHGDGPPDDRLPGYKRGQFDCRGNCRT